MAKKRTAGSGAEAAKPKATRGPGLRKQGWVMKVKTGYWVRPSAKGRKRAQAAIKSRKGKHHSAATIKKIKKAMERVWKRGITKSGRKTLLTRKGKKPKITHAAVLDKQRRAHKAALATLRETNKVKRAAKRAKKAERAAAKAGAASASSGKGKPDVPR